MGWSQDGRAVFVAPTAKLPARVDRIDLQTGERVPWKELKPRDSSGLIDISYIFLSRDAGAYIYSYRQVLSTLYLVEGLR